VFKVQKFLQDSGQFAFDPFISFSSPPQSQDCISLALAWHHQQTIEKKAKECRLGTFQGVVIMACDIQPLVA